MLSILYFTATQVPTKTKISPGKAEPVNLG